MTLNNNYGLCRKNKDRILKTAILVTLGAAMLLRNKTAQIPVNV